MVMSKSRQKSIIIAHRGASGYIPEHSLAAYSLAAGLGADYIELDLVLSRDGIYFALHDLLLDDTTNIAEFPEFHDRWTTRNVEGTAYTGYFVSDFDFFELRLLRLKQRLPATRSTQLDKHLQIPTLSEIFQMSNDLNSVSGRKIGLYIELKHPAFYKSIGFSMEDMILKALVDAKYHIKDVNSDLSNTVAPIVIQCFLPETLIYLRSQCDLPLVQLTGISRTQRISDVWNEHNLDAIMKYANGIGPPTTFLSGSEVDYESASYMVHQAAKRNLVVHPYTLKSDSEMSKNSTEETLYFVCCLEINGIFTDYTDRTKLVVELTHHNPSICRNICPAKFPSETTNPYDFTPLASFLICCGILYALFIGKKRD